jgi:hypothetical protein
MEYLSTAAWTIGFTVIMLVIYKFVINPQIVLTMDASKMGKCPDAWTYNVSTKMCEPNAATGCMPFDPDAPSIQSASAKCNLARTCGTSWGGMCG